MKILLALTLMCLPGLAAAAQPPAAAGYGKLVKQLLKGRKGDKKIAVANFSYPDGSAAGDGDIVSERLTTELVRLEKFRVAERREIQKVLGELKLQSSGATGSDPIKDLGKVLGADWLILGTLTELEGGRIEINARLVGVESGEILGAAGIKVKKDWRGPEAGAGRHEFRKKADLDEYDRAIQKYMRRKAGEENRVVKEMPPSF
jgi:curli biogenesis system outer membrane secretion channel CsgG